MRFDQRVQYRDLNNVTILNSLDPSDRDNIWVPKLAFTNAHGPYQTEVDDLTTGVLIREGLPLKEDYTNAIEGQISSNSSDDRAAGRTHVCRQNFS